jgi:hypothetical protein
MSPTNACAQSALSRFRRPPRPRPQLMVWVPILIGIAFAVQKAVQGTIKFDTITNIVLSLVLIVMPITWCDTAPCGRLFYSRRFLHRRHWRCLADAGADRVQVCVPLQPALGSLL